MALGKPSSAIEWTPKDWWAETCDPNDLTKPLGLVEEAQKSIHGKCSDAFKQSMDEWEYRALKAHPEERRFPMPGVIAHQWHDAKTNRGINRDGKFW